MCFQWLWSFPRCPFHQRNNENALKSLRFNDFGASHALRSTKDIMKLYRNLCVFNDSGASHASCSTKGMMKMYRNPWKSLETHEKLWKSMTIYKIQGKPSEDKKPTWNRAKVSTGAAGRALPASKILPKTYENPWKSIKSMTINRNL